MPQTLLLGFYFICRGLGSPLQRKRMLCNCKSTCFATWHLLAGFSELMQYDPEPLGLMMYFYDHKRKKKKRDIEKRGF